MTRALLVSVCLFSLSAQAQVRVGKLVVESRKVFELNSADIIVADTLEMRDSSRLLLNKLKHENYIRVKVAIIGKKCVIDGKGVQGKPGRQGTAVKMPMGPCKDGIPGKEGLRGLDGTSGVNLFLYIDKLIIEG